MELRWQRVSALPRSVPRTHDGFSLLDNVQARTQLRSHRCEQVRQMTTARAAIENSEQHETIVCRTTGTSRGAIATLIVAGPLANQAVANCFRPRAKSLNANNLPLDRVVFGDWQLVAGGAQQAASEELVVCRVEEHVIEVHCHGGPVGVTMLVESLEAAGCVQRSTLPADVIARADDVASESSRALPTWAALSTTHAAPAWQCEAQLALTHALTERAAMILLDQYHGAWHRAWSAIESAMAAGDSATAKGHARGLLKFAPLGLHLTRPWKVVLAGPPNVGKSSLINRLVGFERAVVFDQPGTTRDVVTAATAIDGWPIELSDTAGIHAAQDPLEQQGVKLARNQLADCDLVVWVTSVDQSDWKVPELEQVESVRVINKTDLISERHDKNLAEAGSKSGPCLRTSATEGHGIGALMKVITERLVPHVPPAGAAVPFEPHHVERLQHVLQHDDEP